MGLTPLDIVNKEFDTKFRGFDQNQVNDYLDIIVAEFEDLINENAQLKKELEDANDKIDYFNQLQDSLNNSIIVAQEAAERLKQNARKEAELILYETERQANEMLEDASEQAREIVVETDALRRSSITYRNELEKLIRQQLDLVTKQEYVELFEGSSIQTNFDPADFKVATSPERIDELAADAEEYAQTTTDTVEIDLTENLVQTEPVQPGLTSTEDVNIPGLTEDNQTPSEPVVETESDDDSLDVTLQFDLNEKLDVNLDNDDFQDDILGKTIRIDLPDDLD